MTSPRRLDCTKRVRPDPSQPLRRHRREVFVARYLEHFDATRAAQEAGYGEASSRPMSMILLGHFSIQERLAYLRKEGGLAPTLPDEVVDQVAQELFEDPSNLYIANPFTGELELDLASATRSQLRSMGFRRKSVTRGGVTTEETEYSRISKPAYLNAIARRIGLNTPNPELQKQDRVEAIEVKVVHSLPIMDERKKMTEVCASGAEFQAWQNETQACQGKDAVELNSASPTTSSNYVKGTLNASREPVNGCDTPPAQSGCQPPEREFADCENNEGSGDEEAAYANEPVLYDPVRGQVFSFDL